MATRPQVISPLQVIFTTFPDAVRYTGPIMTQVRDISNPDGERRDSLSVRIREELARRMDLELAHREAHEALQQQSFAARQAAQSQGGVEGQLAEAELVLPAFFDEQSEPAVGAAAAPAGGAQAPAQPRARLRQSDISLIEVTDDALVRTRVFPRSAQCQRCGHFLLLDPHHPPGNLGCPCCHEGRLVVEPIVFICGRCAARRELLPPGERFDAGRGRKRRRVDENIGIAPRCPECLNGHIHLEKHGTNTVSRWQWRCMSCENFVENIQEPCGTCAVASAPGMRGDYVLMQAIPAAASNALQPLVQQQMFVGEEEVQVGTLHAEAERDRDRDRWNDSFFLTSAVEQGLISAHDFERLRDSCLQNAFLVDRVRAVTTTYGYKAGGVARHPQTPVDPGDRLARFFRDPEGFARFLAYCVSTQGAALVLEFEGARIMERVASLVPSLSGASLADAFAQDAATVGNLEIRDLLRADGPMLATYRALHALEHSLLGSAIQLIGNEALGSRLFPSAATIVLFERVPIGRGGVVQLVNRGPGLVALIDAARDRMMGCAQGCQDGCPACVYVKDAHCNQPIEEFGKPWLPPNSLLGRRGASHILSATMVT